MKPNSVGAQTVIEGSRELSSSARSASSSGATAPAAAALAVALALGIRIFEMAGELGLDRLLVQIEDEALAAARRTVHLLQLVKGLSLAGGAALLAVPVSRALDSTLDPSWFALAALSLALRGAANYDFRERQRRGEFLPALEGAARQEVQTVRPANSAAGLPW